MISISLPSQWKNKPPSVVTTYPVGTNYLTNFNQPSASWVSVSRQVSVNAKFVWEYLESLCKTMEQSLKEVDYEVGDLVIDKEGVEYRVVGIAKDWWNMDYKYPWDHDPGTFPYMVRCQKTKGKKTLVRATANFIKKVQNEQTSES